MIPGDLRWKVLFEEAIFNIERDKPMSWFLKQKNRLTALHPDRSETMIHKRILRKCGGDLEHAIRSRCIEPSSIADYINAMEHITIRTKIVHLIWQTISLKRKEYEIEMDKVEDKKEKNNLSLNDSDSEPSEKEEVPDEVSIEDINVSFEVTEVHTHLPQYNDECMDLIHVQDAKMQRTKPAGGKCYTAGASCITNIVINNREAKLHLDSGAICTYVGKDYLDRIYTNWKESLMPIEGRKFSSASEDMHPFGIFEAAKIFPYPAGSIRLKVEFVVMNNCTSQHFILGNYYLNIYGIDINNHKDRYFTIGENKRQKFAFTPEKREITVIRQVKNVSKEKFVSDQEAFASDNEPLGDIKGHEIDIMLNVERPYPPLLGRTPYPAIPGAREALESLINELVKLGVVRKVGHNQEVEVTMPVIIT
ncbi:hypothetical protein O181_049987 [Austropuccinia psidii MF-1]|uniref:Uncharacterized protein n=1 Tax=Austropuccinia psidii MF-1 TaxID=1389203 RepID=A0A9Q3E2S9_9BASI|nr:hypothetical protein [Austropuccinia psidii MF-1]